MANSFTTRTAHDGDARVLVHLVGVLDTSNLSSTLAVDVSGLTPAPTLVRIDKVEFSVSSQLAVQLLWDATTDVVAFALVDSGGFCFEEWGGLSNNAGTGVTGDINVLTTGYASGTQTFTITLHLTKQGV